MPRPQWKGNFLTEDFYNFLILHANAELDKEFSPLVETPNNTLLDIYKRNVIIGPAIHKLLNKKVLELYTGYDFIKKKIESDHENLNVGAIINTRETNVRHKVKESKHDKNKRKKAQQGGAKKKLINVKKAKTKVKSKVIKKRL